MEYIAIKLYGQRAGILLSACAPGRVSAVYYGEYQPGDLITVEVAEPGVYCIVQFEDTMPEAFVYVAQRRIVFPVPFGEKTAPVPYSPKSFSGSCHIVRARLASPEEIAVRRNLAFNPYDHEFYGQGPMGNGKDTGFYPHATSNIKATSPGFAPRTAIDGVLENNAHMLWPYQAWSNNQDPSAELSVDFGRPVIVDELRLTLRADFPHDSWWTDAEAFFSDGSSEHLTLERTGAAQAFPIRPRTVTGVTLRNLRKHENAALYTALTQIEAWGTEAAVAGAGAEMAGAGTGVEMAATGAGAECTNAGSGTKKAGTGAKTAASASEK